MNPPDPWAGETNGRGGAARQVERAARPSGRAPIIDPDGRAAPVANREERPERETAVSRRKPASAETLAVGRVRVKALSATVVARDHVSAASGRMWPGVPPSASAAPTRPDLVGLGGIVEDLIEEVRDRIAGCGRRRDKRERQRAREDVLSVHRILWKAVAI